MMERRPKRHVHADGLRELGFPEKAIGEAVRAEELGLFDLEPSHDVVERTIARCQDLLRRVTPSRKAERATELAPAAFASELAHGVAIYKGAQARLAMMLEEAPLAAGETWTGLSRLERLPLDCLATISFAQSKRQRPLMIVDNHNLIHPAWWHYDSGFLALRSTVKIVNKIAGESGLPRAAVVMVLRRSITEYRDEDIVAVGQILRTANSDLWMIPYELAEEYMKQDVLVIGGELVLKLNKEVSSPGEAFQTFHETEDTSVASKLRGSIEKMTKRATRIRSDDRLADIAQNIETVQDVRALIQEVMTRNAVTTT